MSRLPRIILAAVAATAAMPLEANPTKPVVTQGSAAISSQGSKMTVKTSANTYINWSTFNIGVGETTTFVQPGASSVVWNRINDPNASQILGTLNANGLVILQNSSGFFVGGQAVLNAAGLIMTTAPIPAPDLAGGGPWDFKAPPPMMNIVNYGQLNAGAGGPIFLIADHVENHGTVNAPGGNIGLYAGQEVMVSSRPDGRGLSAKVSLPQGSVDNSGKLIADAGTIALNAKVVNQGGLIQANSVREVNGVIELVADESLTLAAGSVIEAKGDGTSVSAGGSVLVKSGNKFADDAASKIDVSGGAQGGDGGQVEISAARMGAIQSTIDAHAAAGWTAGKLAIDPANITLTTSGTTASSGTVNAGDAPATLTLNVNSLAAFSQILLQASQNITLSSAWTLADGALGSVLTLQAGGNIALNANLTAGIGWAVNLVAGATFATPTSVTPGVGNITLSGTATVQTQKGDINAIAGGSVTVATGAIRTVAGGNINVDAVAGSVNAGSNPTGYSFKTTGYTVSGNLGGISTGAGGDVNITAGGDVTSFLPTTTSTSPTDAGSGAFGSQPGVVTVTAGGSVFGHFVAADSERNGQIVASTITAGVNAGASTGNYLALSLVKGGWHVNAPNGSIFLQEVRNPNGALNGSGFGAAPFKHLFDYDPHSFLNLNAGNAVVLTGQSLPRFTQDIVPVLYPGTVSITSGSGGVTLGNNLTLFPSPYGELNVKTTGGGILEGNGKTLAMSDSATKLDGTAQWTTAVNFASDHAAIPVQINNPDPVVFNISGKMDSINIITPKETHITVAGEMDNTSFTGQNLHSGDKTSVTVTGRIFNQNVYSLVTLANALVPPDPRFPGDAPGYLQYLQDAVVAGSGPASAGAGAVFPALNFFYIPQTKQIGYLGSMDLNTEKLLSGPLQVKTYSLDGKVNLDANGNYVTKQVVLGVDPIQIQSLYSASQSSINPVNAPTGFKIGGPGEFNVKGQSLDLGAAFGIVSEGPAINKALAKPPVAGPGADININLDGDLNMFSSEISSYYGGKINITSGGSINVGFQDLPLSNPKAPRGIWTSGQSDVNVTAQGDVNVAGSRIAAFAGGDVNVTSLTGNVNAGNGGFAAVLVNEVVVDPVTFAVRTPQQPIAGSGILATTLPDAPPSQQVGNITITTPQGSILASQGGIVQDPLNGNSSLVPTVTLTAGTRDADGKVIYPGDINAGDSGIIGINTILDAAGNISGLVIARGDSTISAAANVSGTFVAGGTASFNAGGSIGGIAIAGNAVNVAGGTFEGVALASSVSGGGAQTALPTTATASATGQNAGAQQQDVTKANTSDVASTDDEENRKKAQKPLLAKYVGRVTVILPEGNK